MGEKLKCPVCGREIDTQASVQISASMNLDYSGITHADLVYKDGDYFLVLPANITCPFCKELFCLDIWVTVLKQFLLAETKD
jgi:hypothetical protein